MKVKECMSTDVHLARPDQTLQEVARTMAQIDAGIVPVAEQDRLVGMITDRDITVRAVAKGLPPDTQVRQCMSSEVKYCYEDEDIEEVAENMRDIQVRRLPVMNRQKRLVGIIALGDIAMRHQIDLTGEAMYGISQRGGQHSQSTEARL